MPAAALVSSVPGYTERGLSTPPHSAVEPGHEYDMPVLTAQHPPAHVYADDEPAGLGPTPRRSVSSAKARPVSMPPQSQAAQPTPSAAPRTDEAPPRSRNGTKSGGSRNRQLGDYTLSKSLGAGSMGKVKLAHHNLSGGKYAVKILPRTAPNTSSTANMTPEQIAKQATKDASKEIRTIREAALSMLLHHPYICGMREMIIHTHHYYMVFEYVNGGQMLDYIISHGRLRERVARKFTRQIGSALEYLHRNNVVHRDLKIENILISQTGNIKLIDFGLSNLFDPVGQLTTFCGSLYFAAPELLNAKLYTGPEVDVWSFGVVLYVLVCGKVPFDDQSMPALHAKIKRGLVEYPVWLSAECKHILSRMLVTNPTARATLTEVHNHPWMLRGFGAPPDPHLVRREPLRPDELDRAVIRGMEGFEFGPDDDVEHRLVEILTSETYVRSVQAWERRREAGTATGARGLTDAASSATLRYNGGANGDSRLSPKKSKRFSGLDWYRRKLFSPSSSPPGSPLSRSPPNSQSHLVLGALTDAKGEPVDPTNGFHPLLSMYYLAREKMERDRVYGPGIFASSQVSVDGAANAASAVDEPAVPSTVAKAVSQPVLAKKDAVPGKADYSMQLPRLPAPATSHFSERSYDAPQATPSPTSATFGPQPRARDASLALPKRSDLAHGSSAPSSPVSPSMPLPRAPAATTHRRSHSLSQRQSAPRGWSLFGGGGVNPVNEQADDVGRPIPASAGPAVTMFSEKERYGEREQSNLANLSPPMEDQEREAEADQQQTADAEKIPTSSSAPSSTPSGGHGIVRRFGSLLIGREGSMRIGGVSKRASILGGLSPRPSGEADRHSEKKERSPYEREGEKMPERAMTTSPVPAGASDAENGATPHTPRSQSQPPLAATATHRRAATVLDPHHSKRHERRGSTGGAFFSGGTIGRNRRPSTGMSSTSKPLGDRLFGKTEEEPERPVEPEQSGGEEAHANGHDEPQTEDEGRVEKDFKPLFLKGLFSVATTSTKSPPTIKKDIRRVLDRMQVQYRETRTGFDCIHMPSIDLSSLQDKPRRADQAQNSKRGSSDSGATGTTGRSVMRKASILSFGTKNKEKSKERLAESVREKEKVTAAGQQQSHQDMNVVNGGEPARPSDGSGPPLTPTPSGSSSFFNVSAQTHAATEGHHESADNTVTGADDAVTIASATGDADAPATPRPRSPVMAKSPTGKSLPPIPRDFGAAPQAQVAFADGRTTPVMPTGEVDPEIFDTIKTNSLAVRFDINVVKVPMLPFHGIQFRRAAGDGWQYHMLARRVLTELKL